VKNKYKVHYGMWRLRKYITVGTEDREAIKGYRQG
jgi:hypothetical protein